MTRTHRQKVAAYGGEGGPLSLLTPESKDSISNTMKVAGSRYAQYINLRYRRTGTMWEGRHRASLVQSDRYLLCCYRYIELNPVRAGMVRRLDEYHWSSYGANAWSDVTWLTPHEEFRRLDAKADQRCKAYRALFQEQLSDVDLHFIRKAAHYCQPVGDDRFRAQVERQYGIKTGQMGRGVNSG